MTSALVGVAFSVVRKALAPVTDPVLELWAASKDLGPNVKSLKTELLCVKAVLEENLGRETSNTALEELLGNLQDLAYDAENVLDELDYFRIQDELRGTFDAVDEHPKGCAQNLVFNATHTAKAVGKLIWSHACCSSAATPASRLQPREPQADRGEVNGCIRKLTSGPRNTIHAVSKCLPCSSLPPLLDNDADGGGNVQREQEKEITKLEFNRVDFSKRIKLILEQLQPMCQKICMVLGTLGSNLSTVKHSRPATISESVEPKLYGRDCIMNSIIHDITRGKYCAQDLTIIPIVGPGGIGKTTLAQHIYHKQEVLKHFQVKVWVCVSLNFSADNLIKEIEKYIPKVGDEKNGTPREVIEQRLKSKRFLLILDDIWKDCNEDEWKTILLPFKKSQVKGNIIMVTTRFPALAQMVKTADASIQLQGLNNEEFKELFLAFVFADEQTRKDHKFLLETGDKIVGRLKGSPLAAKTVGRLLRNRLDLGHWTRVLESKEWESEKGEHDIMPALKLSYDNLPFHLQQCFIYSALFPEDYKFKTEELVHLWIGLDILRSHGKNKRTEDIGLDHLTELVSYGFFRKEEYGESELYVIHDLLHELALKVSSHECLSINSHNVRSIQIPPSIRHLSINIDDTSVKDRMAFEKCKTDLSTLHTKLKVENLRSLMLFGEHHGSFVKTFAGLFKEAKALHCVFLSNASYNVEDLLQNFSNCVHIRYLRILGYQEGIRLPTIISRFYHLRVLDLRQCHCQLHHLTRDMNNLVKLRHFLVPSESMHSEIFKVGTLKSLQELRRFAVKGESQDFGLNQLGDLVELCGSLSIYNLEKVGANEEADAAKLNQKAHLHELALHWDSDRSTKDSAREEQVLESLKPSGNLVKLCIRGHGGSTCPSWLGANISVKNLEFLRLDDVSWKNLPPLGELLFVDEKDKECCQSSKEGQSFAYLKRIELVKIPKLKRWTGNGPCDLFSHLEVLIIIDCPELMELPFTHHTGCEPEHEDHMTWFPKLGELQIAHCPKLSSLPCIPWSSCTRSANIEQVGSGLERLKYMKRWEYLVIRGKDDLGGAFWRVVAFHNLSHLRRLDVTKCPPLSLDHLKMLSSLKTLHICASGDAVWLPEGDCCVGYQFSSVEEVTIEWYGGSGERLTRLLSYFPMLLSFSVCWCEKLTGLGVVDQQKKQQALGQLSSSINEVEAGKREQQQGARGEQEIAAAGADEEELLLLPPQLQRLYISDCPNLVLCPDSLSSDRDRNTGRTGAGEGGLQGLTSLRSLQICYCPRFLSSYSSCSSSPCFPLPASLEELSLESAVGMATVSLSNLFSLSDLSIRDCEDLRGEEMWHLLTQGPLTKLFLSGTPNLFAGSESSLPHEQEFPSSSSKLQELDTDDVVGVLAAPICAFLSTSLTELMFWRDTEVERLTTEKEEALQLLTSLETIRFWECNKLQSLPAGLHRLRNLKILHISDGAAIQSLPMDGLPSSLQELRINNCPAIRLIPKECLPNSLQTVAEARLAGRRGCSLFFLLQPLLSFFFHLIF
ncbi:unnamed protein product [Urochloa decumbens]|uniref:AAA+ ATPase domain-containing protein n=1 Tax=Urochloa decumbens TaxID=240449 RepID=A0ABC9C085_9POAL